MNPRATILFALSLITALGLNASADPTPPPDKVRPSTVTDDPFYRQFLLEDKDQHNRNITSPVLIDTNNLSPKVTNAVLDLDALRQGGELSGVHLGMTMAQVIGAWGKPRGVSSHCGWVHRLPVFLYKDGCLLGFDGNSLETARIYHPNLTFANGLSKTSKVKEFVRVLGKPTSRHDSGKDHSIVYVTPKASLRLDFDRDGLLYLWLERSAQRAQSWE